MLETELTTRLHGIFDLTGGVTLDSPGETKEQDTLFVKIDECKSRIREARHSARVLGQIIVFSNHQKLPLGFFAKQIEAADPSLTKDFFFFEMEESIGGLMNLCERSCKFVFLFDDQYNPELGEINEVELTITEVD
jgi:hypothetical protein